MSNDLKPVARLSTPVEAALVRSRLEDAGVRAYLDGEISGAWFGQFGTTFSGVKVLVAQTDLQHAKEVLAAKIPGPAAGQSEPEFWTCPKCRTEMESGFTACWECGTTVDGVEDPDFEVAPAPVKEEREERPPSPWLAGFLVLCPPALVIYLLAKYVAVGPPNSERAAERRPLQFGPAGMLLGGTVFALLIGLATGWGIGVAILGALLAGALAALCRRKWLILLLTLGVLAFMAVFGESSSTWDAAFGPAEYQFVFRDVHGRPVQGVELRVDREDGENSYHYPIDNYFHGGIPTSDENGLMTFHCCGHSFGGEYRTHFFLIRTGRYRPPQFTCRFVHDGKEVHRVPFSRLADLRFAEGHVVRAVRVPAVAVGAPEAEAEFSEADLVEKRCEFAVMQSTVTIRTARR